MEAQLILEFSWVDHGSSLIIQAPISKSQNHQTEWGKTQNSTTLVRSEEQFKICN